MWTTGHVIRGCAVHLAAVSWILTRYAVQLAAVSNLSLGIGTSYTNWCTLSTNQDHSKGVFVTMYIVKVVVRLHAGVVVDLWPMREETCMM
jgi:hypothetical protein